MDNSCDTVFGERFQSCCPEKVYELRRALRDDVQQKDGKIILIKNYGKYLAILPSLHHIGQELIILYKDKYVDLDMQNDLERSEVLNWCRTTKPLYPIRTTADGNCLLHAVSQALWGIEDTDCFLRRIVYANLVTDPREAFKRRWIFHHKNSEDLQRLDVRLNTVECSQEWEVVINATDDVSNSHTHGLPYTALESIHLYVLANVLRRPIIVIADPMARNVFGQTMQDNRLNGIYLPLEWTKEKCHKSPVLIGYSLNHFAPLLFEEESANDRTDHTARAVPLVAKSMDSLPVRFLMPNEESSIGNIMSDYLHTTEVYFDMTPIPAAKVKPHSLPDTVNIIQACASDCENKFRRLRGEQVPLFNFQVAQTVPNPQAGPSQRLNIALNPQRQGLQQLHNRQKCQTIGCDFYANPEYGTLCTKCFQDYTIQYARQEEAGKRLGHQLPSARRIPLNQLVVQEPTLPVQPTRQQSGNYHDLSMIGEDCHANCGFKCSTETYPYCHECYPKFANNHTPTQPLQEQAQPTQPEISMLPNDCNTVGCPFKCSKATFPYCHSCYLEAEREHTNIAPSAPPPSLPRVAGSSSSPVAVGITASANRPELKFSMSAHADHRIGTGSLSKKCKTVDCQNMAIRGNNGLCDDCYKKVFGVEAVSPVEEQKTSLQCSSPGCDETPRQPGTLQCWNCFLKGMGTQQGHPQSLTGSKPQGMNIVPTPEHKILNSSQTQTSPTFPTRAQNGSLHSVPSEHDETAEQRMGQFVTSAAIAQQAQEEARYIGQKYICATPGCEGRRAEGSELCQLCLKGKQQEYSSGQAESLVESCSQELSKEEMKKLNPVVVSSRDKVKCAYQSCGNMIYPPKKLCDVCSAYLEKATASRSRELNYVTARSVSQCKTAGCTFFGMDERNGFCSSCYKAQVSQRHTAPLASKPQQKRSTSHTTPLAFASKPDLPATVRGKGCIEPGCTRFGDPTQADRCSEHYEKAIALFPPPSEKSLEEQRRQTQAGSKRTARGSTERNVGNLVVSRSQPVAGEQGSVQEEDAFNNSYGRLFTSKRSAGMCRNGCGNYANSAKKGYCNTCFTEKAAENGLEQNGF